MREHQIREAIKGLDHNDKAAMERLTQVLEAYTRALCQVVDRERFTAALQSEWTALSGIHSGSDEARDEILRRLAAAAATSHLPRRDDWNRLPSR